MSPKHMQLLLQLFEEQTVRDMASDFAEERMRESEHERCTVDDRVEPITEEDRQFLLEVLQPCSVWQSINGGHEVHS